MSDLTDPSQHPASDGDPASPESLFHHAQRLPPAERASFLDRHCGSDPCLRALLEDLLRAADRAGDFLASNAATTASGRGPESTARVGVSIGPYKLLQKIGEGGFGTVFMAEQGAPVRRKVALKIIKPGMDSRQVIGRFEAERQALALMDHPHIARVFDAGLTEPDQRPYFVMEYVVGNAITTFADAHKLTVPERLALFQQVCSAVQHAHTKGIIHRDLKPGNVLVSMVDGKPFAKVIDFGIAKATGASGGRLTDKTFFTEHLQLIGTPEYMSPEQAEGSPDIDTRTDVYALGVLLYELLTGTTPIEAARLRSAAFDEMRRLIREEEPLAPSMKLSRSLEKLASTAAARKVEPARLSGLIKGELDWIVLKALEKERARRYETPSALADDVRRHLAGDAVIAAPVSAAYRLRKFVRRNKGAVVTVSAVVLALAAGGSVAAWQWREASHVNGRLRDTLAFTRDHVTRLRLQVRGTPAPGWEEVRRKVDGEIIGYQADPKGGMIEYRPLDIDGQDETSLTKGLVYDLFITAMESHLEVERRADAAEWSAYTANLALAQAAIDAGDYPEARKRLAEAPLGKRGWEWEFLHRSASSTEYVIHGAMPRTAPALSPDGNLLAGAMDDFSVRLWNTVDGREHGTLRGHSGDVLALAFSPDGRTLASASDDNTVRVWDVETKRLLATWNCNREFSFSDALVFSSDGSRLATSTSYGTGMVWSVPDGAVVMTLRDVDSKIAFSPDGQEVLYRVSTTGDVAHLRDVATGELRLVLRGHAERIRAMAFSDDGKVIVTASDDHTLRTWDATTGAQTLIGKHAREVNSVRFDDNGWSLVSSADDGSIRVWDLRHETQPAVLSMRGWRVITTVLGQSGTILFASGWCPLTAWDMSSGARLVELQGRAYGASLVGVTPDGSRLIARTSDDAISAWNATSLGALIAAAGPENPLGYFNDDGGGWERDATQDLLLAVVRACPSGVGAASMAITTPDSTRKLAASDRLIRVFDLTSPLIDGVFREVAVFRMPEAVTNLQMTGDGTRLIIHLADGSARVWDIRDPEERRKDLQAEWAERRVGGPAGAYLDTLWASATPDDELRDAIINDASLTPLRRLVAAEMLEERLEDDRLAAEEAFAELEKTIVPSADATADATPADPVTLAAEFKAAMHAKAAAADLPARVKARVMKMAEAWEYRAPEPSDAEKLAEETKQRRLAEADVVLLRLGDTAKYEFGTPPHELAELRSALDTVARYRGADSEDVLKAEIVSLWHFRDQVEGSERALRLYRRVDPSHPKWLHFAATRAAAEANARLGRVREALRLTHAAGLELSQVRRESLGTDPWWASLGAPGCHLIRLQGSVTGHIEDARVISQGLAAVSRAEVWSNVLRVAPMEGWSTARILEGLASEAGAQSEDAGTMAAKAILRHRLSKADDATLAAAAEIDGKTNSLTGGKVLDRDGHRAAAREALAKARALMAPAADGTPSPWADDEDAKALLAEAERLIEGGDAMPAAEPDAEPAAPARGR